MATSHDLDAFSEAEEIAAKNVHVDCLCDVVCVVARQDHICINLVRTAVECLPSEYATEGAVVGQPNHLDDFVHGPPI